MGEREITARSDVYALGCITYEMLLGEPPFTGPTAQSIVAKVMTAEPVSLTSQRRSIPAHVEAAVFTALEKLPADRFATAAEFAAGLANPSLTVAPPGIKPAVPRRRRDWLFAAALAVVALIAGLALGGRKGNVGSIGPTDVVRTTLFLDDSTVVRAVGNLRLAISRSGKRVAYGPDGADEALWVRDLDQSAARLLQDTKGGSGPSLVLVERWLADVEARLRH